MAGQLSQQARDWEMTSTGQSESTAWQHGRGLTRLPRFGDSLGGGRFPLDEIDGKSTSDCGTNFALRLRPVGAYERRHTDFVDQIIAMMMRGMTAPEMQRFLAETHSLDVPVEQLARLSDVISAQVSAWRDQPLQAMYPLVYFDTLSVQVKDQGVVGHKTVHLALGVRGDGRRDMLGVWIEHTDAVAFWSMVFNDLQTRGVRDIMIAVAENHMGLAQALAAAFAATMLQTSLVRLIREAHSHPSWNHRQALSAAIQSIYTAPDACAAQAQLEAFTQGPLGRQFPSVPATWRRDWNQLISFFALPLQIRAVICATDQMDGVHARLGRIVSTRGHFCSDDEARRLIWLALLPISADWHLAPCHWPVARGAFEMHYGARMTGHGGPREEPSGAHSIRNPVRVDLHQQKLAMTH